MRTILYVFITFCILARATLLLATKSKPVSGQHKELFVYGVLFGMSYLIYGLRLNLDSAVLLFSEMFIDAILGAVLGFFTTRAYILALKGIK